MSKTELPFRTIYGREGRLAEECRRLSELPEIPGGDALCGFFEDLARYIEMLEQFAASESAQKMLLLREARETQQPESLAPCSFPGCQYLPSSLFHSSHANGCLLPNGHEPAVSCHPYRTQQAQGSELERLRAIEQRAYECRTSGHLREVQAARYILTGEQ